MPGGKGGSDTNFREEAVRRLKSGLLRPEEELAEDVQRLIHELQVHQIELEMQNEELRNVQVALEESRTRYVDLYDFAPVGYVIFDKDGLILEANLTAATQLGIQRSYLIRKPFSIYVLESDRQAFRGHLKLVLKTREPHTCEVRLHAKDDSEFYARLESIYIEAANGTGTCRMSIIDVSPSRVAEEILRRAHDELEKRVEERTIEQARSNQSLRQEIIERKHAEDALRESEARFRTLFQNMTEGVALHEIVNDENGMAVDYRIISANPAFEKQTGMKLEQVLGQLASKIYGFDDAPYLERYALVASCGKPDIFEAYFPPMGLYFHISASSPKQGHFVTVFENITERKRSEKALQAAHEKLNGIIEFLPDATFVVDRAGKVTAWNLAMEEMTGVRKEAMIGMGNYAYAVPFYGEPRHMLIDLVMKNIDGHINLYDFAQSHDKLLRAELWAPTIDGGKGAYLWGTASPLFDMNGNLIGAIEAIRDITEIKQIESALLKRETDLEDKAHQLEEINTAQKVLLRRREEDKKDMEESLLTNVKESILPFLEKLKKTRLDENQKAYLEIVESQLGEIVSPFLKRLSSRFTNLTPMEIKVANLIKEGRVSKEIAEILGVAEQTILTHRSNLRAKLKLRNEKTNLRSHLMSLA